MLLSLSIKNFALIESLETDFSNQFSVITGETGAGKSILLGALGLVLGNRADLTSLKDKEQKCIIEAVFFIENYNLKPFFQANDLDYEDKTIIRREILPSGKSRAFINDSPVNLQELQANHEAHELPAGHNGKGPSRAGVLNQKLRYFQRQLGHRHQGRRRSLLVLHSRE